jgi:hypothetical protein
MALTLKPIADHVATMPMEMLHALDALSSLAAGNAAEHNEVLVEGGRGLKLQLDLDGEVSITIETEDASLFSDVVYLQTRIAETAASAATGRRLGDLVDFGGSAFSLLADLPILEVRTGDPTCIMLDAPMVRPLPPVVNPVLR